MPHSINSRLLWSHWAKLLCQKGSHPLFVPIVRDVVDWSHIKKAAASRPAQHTHPCTCTYTQRPPSDLSSRPMCAISKQVYRSYQSSMNTNSMKRSGVNGLNKCFHLCAQQYFVLWTAEDAPLGKEWRVKNDTMPCNFSVHTHLQTHKDFHVEGKASKMPEYIIKSAL